MGLTGRGLNKLMTSPKIRNRLIDKILTRDIAEPSLLKNIGMGGLVGFGAQGERGQQ